MVILFCFPVNQKILPVAIRNMIFARIFSGKCHIYQACNDISTNPFVEILEIYSWILLEMLTRVGETEIEFWCLACGKTLILRNRPVKIQIGQFYVLCYKASPIPS